MRALLIRASSISLRNGAIYGIYSAWTPQYCLKHLSTLSILGLETSCDDTGVSIVQWNRQNAAKVLAESVSSQFQTHGPWKGVVPAMAARDHERNLPTVLQQVLRNALDKESNLKLDAVAATAGPGLALCLKSGFLTGKMIARYLNVPFIPVHHMAAHALVSRLEDPTIEYPFLTLLVSGGHSMIVLVKYLGDYQILGSTLDDSVGEAFDKVARAVRVGLHQGKLGAQYESADTTISPNDNRGSQGTRFKNFYPTYSSNLPDSEDPPVMTHYGVLLEKLASHGDPYAFDLKVPLEHQTPASSRKNHQRRQRQRMKLGINEDPTETMEEIHPDIQFSFSGLKTRILQIISSGKCDPTDFHSAANLAATFQRVATTHLTQQLGKAVNYCVSDKMLPISTVVVAGGVAANSHIRQCVEQVMDSSGIDTRFPSLKYCTDNGTMIAWAGMEEYKSALESGRQYASPEYSDFSARWPLGESIPRYDPQKHDHDHEISAIQESKAYTDVISLLGKMDL